jgi:hypothetical protein
VRFAALLEEAEEAAEGVAGSLLVFDVSGVEDVGGSFGSSSFSGHGLLIEVEFSVISLRLSCIRRSAAKGEAVGGVPEIALVGTRSVGGTGLAPR